MYYNYGKNYFLSIDQYDLSNTTDIEILYFLKGYIDLNSKIILPTNITNYLKNINSIYYKYPLMIIHFRKETNQDDILLNRIIKLFKNYLKIDFLIESKKKIYNKIKYNTLIKLENHNVLSFLNSIYSNNLPNNDLSEVDDYIYSIYHMLSNYKYICFDSENDNMQFFIPKCNIKLIHPASIKPRKQTISDIGYCIYIIKEKKRLSNKSIIYETGIIVNPQYGYCIKLIQSNDLSKYGYQLCTQYIQPNYPVDITLTKIDKSLPDIKLPFACALMVIQEFIHYDLIN